MIAQNKLKVILEIIVGPMFAGKTEELIRRLVQGRFAKKRMLVLRPSRDKREKRNVFQLIAANENLQDYKDIFCETFGSADDLIRLVKTHKPQILAIDEAQFIQESWIVEVIKELQRLDSANNYGIEDLKIIISGLDMDFNGNQFNQMPILLAIADRVMKMSAICIVCGNDDASMTYRIPGISQEKILVGDKDTYEVRCRACHKLPN